METKPEELLKLADVKRITKFSISTIYRKIEAGTFPRPYRVGESAVRWKPSDITEWQNSLQKTGVEDGTN